MAEVAEMLAKVPRIVRAAREAQGFTQHQLAVRAGLNSYNMVGNVETGKGYAVETILKIGAALDLTPNELFGLEEVVWE